MQQVKEETSLEVVSKIQVPKAVVVIGASTGGPTALAQIIPKFPKDFPVSIIIIQHMRPGFTRLLANQLDRISELPVDEARAYQPLRPASAVLSPGHHGIRLEQTEDKEEHPYC